MEKFCLKWNEFTNNINDSINDLRSGEEFTDVTLAVESGEQIKAHRIVLSACSPFFRKLFKGGSHPHPFVYMKGITTNNLSSIIDFAYLGEVNIDHEYLESFLASARELKIKGLTAKEESIQLEPTDHKSEKPSDMMRESTATSEYEPGELKHHIGHDIHKASENHTNDNFWEEVSTSNRTIELEGRIETVLEESEHIEFPENVAFNSFEETTSDDLNQLDDKIDNMMERVGEVWTCKMCAKTATIKQAIRQHVEIHIKGLTLPCSICGKSYGSKNSLKKHKSMYHRH